MDFKEVKIEDRQGLESVGEAGAGEVVSFNHGREQGELVLGNENEHSFGTII